MAPKKKGSTAKSAKGKGKAKEKDPSPAPVAVEEAVVEQESEPEREREPESVADAETAEGGTKASMEDRMAKMRELRKRMVRVFARGRVSRRD